RFAGAKRASAECVLNKGIEVFLLGELLLEARHPIRGDGPINRQPRFVHSYFGERRIVASRLQSHEATEAVANHKGCVRLGSQGEHIFALFGDAVVMALWATLASPASLDGVNRKMLGQGAREGCVVG